jgi:hypothetical protein
MPNLDRPLQRKLSKAAELVNARESVWRELLAEEREVLRRKVDAKQALDEARAQQRQAVYEALQAGASTVEIAVTYGMSMATVNKYGKPIGI